MPEMINPYIAGAPVTEKTMFFGRQDVFDWVAEGRCPNPDNCAVWVIDRDGSGASPIFESSDQALVQGLIAWSPNGKSVAATLVDGTSYLIDADCPSQPDGCDAASRTEIDGIPEHWMHNFHSQWSGEEQAGIP